jgi:hypothetical protein
MLIGDDLFEFLNKWADYNIEYSRRMLRDPRHITNFPRLRHTLQHFQELKQRLDHSDQKADATWNLAIEEAAKTVMGFEEPHIAEKVKELLR